MGKRLAVGNGRQQSSEKSVAYESDVSGELQWIDSATLLENGLVV